MVHELGKSVTTLGMPYGNFLKKKKKKPPFPGL